MATVQLPQEQRLRLSCVPWGAYVAFGDLLGPRHVRLTYDEGEMEFMTLSSEHEHVKKLLARLLETLAEELDIDIASFGSMTCRRQDLEKGLEPDECYWIAHEISVRGRSTINLEIDPPPDLVLEIEISRSSLNRLHLYARLGVPEVWRWDGQELHIELLQANGLYKSQTHSQAFPVLAAVDLQRFLAMTQEQSETQVIKSWRSWLRARQNEKPGA